MKRIHYLIVPLIALFSACQSESVPDKLYPFNGMIRVQSDTLYFVDCDFRTLQWVAGGTVYDDLMDTYQDASKDPNGFLFVYLQGVMANLPLDEGDTVVRGLKVYTIDSIQEGYSCLRVNAYAAGGKYSYKNANALSNEIDLVLGFNGRAQMNTIDGFRKFREPGEWSAIDSTQIQLIINEKDTLKGLLDWQRNLSLTGDRFETPVTLYRQ